MNFDDFSPPAIFAYIGIGANLDQPQQSVQNAILLLAKLPMTQQVAHSRLLLTAPLDAPGDNYVNAVVQLKTSLSALTLLENLQEIESNCGRTRPYRHAPRTLDLDLLLYGQKVISTPVLEVPHPRLTERAFVLLPLLELTPDIFIPGKGAAATFVARVSDQKIISYC